MLEHDGVFTYITADGKVIEVQSKTCPLLFSEFDSITKVTRFHHMHCPVIEVVVRDQDKLLKKLLKGHSK